MQAESGNPGVNVSKFISVTDIPDDFAELSDRRNQYLLEISRLEQALIGPCRRRNTRQARLLDLQTRLLPCVQNLLAALENQSGGGI